MRPILMFIYSVYLTNAFGADIRYPAASIPQQLKENAVAVKRSELVAIDIRNASDVIITHKFAVTILNDAGDGYSEFNEWYDKMREIISLEGSLYDGAGTLLRKAKGKDFRDLSAVNDMNLMDDNRIKQHRFYYSQYPYTVEYEVVVRSKQTFMLPAWYPQDAIQLAVQESNLRVVTPKDFELRYKSNTGEPNITESASNRQYEWQVSSVAATKKYFAAPVWHELTPSVVLAPVSFQIQGYRGSMENWQQFGKFIFELNKERDELPQQVKEKVHNLIAHASTDQEKIRLLYKFLQDNTRYISIQLGIGGWQPFPASDVATKGYGDCKALSNYMYSILKFAGIRSHYALIYAGDNIRPISDSFISSQFNHAILCVPTSSDTLWLECTSQTALPGYLGSFTGNRKALLIDPSGGTLVSTPVYKSSDNRQLRTIEAKIDAMGDLKVESKTVFSGSQFEPLETIHLQGRDKIMKTLQSRFNLPTYNVNEFNYTRDHITAPTIEEKLKLTVSNYASVSGKRMFIVPNVLNRMSYNLIRDDQRKCDFVFQNEFSDVDEVQIEIPEGYEAESIPEKVSIKTTFGLYSSHTSFVNNKIVYKRVFERYAVRVSASQQQSVLDFFSQVDIADRRKVVLKKSD